MRVVIDGHSIQFATIERNYHLDKALPPWKHEFPQLVSLWEMNIYSVLHICKATDTLGLIEKLVANGEQRRVATFIDRGDASIDSVEFRAIISAFEFIKSACHEVELDDLVEYIDRMVKRVQGPGVSGAELKSQTAAIREMMTIGLSKRCFVFVREANAQSLLDLDKKWGVVWDAFPKSKDDAQEAIYCYALSRNQASIYHSMMVLEHGLKSLSVALSVTYDKKSWGTIIDNAEKAIAAQRTANAPRDVMRDELLTFYAEVAKEFTYFREAWRNHTAHNRGDYDENDAKKVLTHVHDFMTILSKRLREVA